jgi:hypothetical protein
MATTKKTTTTKSRGLGKKTKCSIAGSQLGTKSSAKATKSKAGRTLGKSC